VLARARSSLRERLRQAAGPAAGTVQHAGNATVQHTGAIPDLEGATTVETPFGPLYMEGGDRFMPRYIEQFGVWEPGETTFVQEFVKPGMVVVDAGAHVGYFSVLCGHLVGPDGLVFSFEPDPRNYELLLANVWTHELTNVVCLPWAVGDECRFTQLYLAPENTGDHRLYASEEDRRTVTVRSVALDRVPLLRPPVDFVKIDVQGAEEAAIRGMQGLLGDSPEVIVSAEFWPHGMRRFGSDERGLLDYYRSLGYRMRVLDPEVRGISELTDEELLELCAQEDGNKHVNLILDRSPGAVSRVRRQGRSGPPVDKARAVASPRPARHRLPRSVVAAFRRADGATKAARKTASPADAVKGHPGVGNPLERANALVGAAPRGFLAFGARLAPLRRVGTRRLNQSLLPYVSRQHEIASAIVESTNQLAEAVARLEATAAQGTWAFDRLQPLPVAPELVVSARTGQKMIGYDTPSSPDGGHAAYRGFEDVFRGSEELIREHQEVYLDLLGPREPVVDIGCGRGEFLDLLRTRGIVARGVDPDAGMVAHSRRKGHEVVQSDAVEYLDREPSDSLGAVFAAHVVEHLPYDHLMELLKVVYDKLVRNGLFVMETVNPHSLVALRAFWLDLTHRVPIYPQVAVTLCRLQGFERAFVSFPRETATGRLEQDLREEDSYAVIATKVPVPSPERSSTAARCRRLSKERSS